MRSLQRRSLLKSVVYSKVFAGLLVLVALYTGYVVWGMYEKYQMTGADMAMAAEKLDQAKARKATLQTKVERLQTKAGVEAKLRQKFLIAKEGEHVMVIIDGNDKENEKVTSKQKKKDESWWEGFLSIF